MNARSVDGLAIGNAATRGRKLALNAKRIGTLRLRRGDRLIGYHEALQLVEAKGCGEHELWIWIAVKRIRAYLSVTRRKSKLHRIYVVSKFFPQDFQTRPREMTPRRLLVDTWFRASVLNALDPARAGRFLKFDELERRWSKLRDGDFATDLIMRAIEDHTLLDYSILYAPENTEGGDDIGAAVFAEKEVLK